MKPIFLMIPLATIFYKVNGQSDREQLQKLNATFIHNYVTNDTASHNKILHRDFKYISSEGAVIGRAEYLKGWATGFDPKVITYWDYRDELIDIIGSVALVHSINKCTLLENGKEVTGMTLYTDTYVKEKEKWLCVRAQITKLSPQQYRGDDRIVRKYINGK
jgi:Domain of unknown function (DUF4440)